MLSFYRTPRGFFYFNSSLLCLCFLSQEKITTGLNTDDLDVVETKQSNMPKNEFKWCAEGDAHMKKCSGDEREAIEDGEIIDLEDGELRSGGESDLDSLSGRRVIQSTFSEVTELIFI